MPVSKKKGLSVKTFKGLNKQRIERKSGGAGSRLAIKQGETVGIQFLTKPEDFTEYEVHSWNDGDWHFVPCTGDECPLCVDEDTDRRKKAYRFAALVYSFRDKAVKVMEGPKDLAGRVIFRYERKPAMFLKRTYEVSKLATTPVAYDFAVGEDDLVSSVVLKKSKLTIDEFLEDQLKAFYGSDLPEVSKSDLVSDPDDDEDEDDEDEEDEDEEETQEYTLAELKKMTLKALRTLAESLDIDTEDQDKTDLIEAIVEAGEEDDDEDEDEEEEDEDDEEEEDEDEDEEDEDDEEEDDEPPAKRPAKKTAAKKVAARRHR